MPTKENSDFGVISEIQNYELLIDISKNEKYKSGTFFINVTADPMTSTSNDTLTFLISYLIGKHT